MPFLTINASSLAHLGDRFDRRAAQTPAVVAGRFAALAPGLENIGVTEIRAVTPVKSGDLRDSTDSQSVVGFDSITTQIAQPAESKPDESGNWGGELYVKWVVGGRGPVLPINKKALAGPGFGPVHGAGPAAPNPYPTEAAPAIQTAVGLLAQHWSVSVLDAIVSGL